MDIEQGRVYQDERGCKYIMINSGPVQNMRMYLKPDGTVPCPAERQDHFTTCSCGFPHSACKRTGIGMKCMSTHGLSGYAPGSYFESGVVVCGSCGERIKAPRPIGLRVVYFTFGESLRSWEIFWKWMRDEPKAMVPRFPQGE